MFWSGNINFILNASFSKLIYDKYTMDNVSGIVKVKDKKIFFDNLKMNMLGGAIAMNGTYDAVEPAKPLMDIAFDLKDVDVQQAVAQLSQLRDQIKAAEELEKRFITQIQAAMGEASVIAAASGSVLATWKRSADGRRVDTDALKKDGLYEQYSNASEGSRRFLLKV